LTDRKVRLIVALGVIFIVALASYLIVSAGRSSTGKLAARDSTPSTSIPSVRYAERAPVAQSASARAVRPTTGWVGLYAPGLTRA